MEAIVRLLGKVLFASTFFILTAAGAIAFTAWPVLHIWGAVLIGLDQGWAAGVASAFVPLLPQFWGTSLDGQDFYYKITLWWAIGCACGLIGCAMAFIVEAASACRQSA